MKEGGKPKHSKAYPILEAFEKVTEKKYVRICGIGVLKEQANHLQRAAPYFIQPKNTGDVRVLTDF